MLSLIIPVYRNEDSISLLLDRVDTLHQATAGKFEAIFVIDGSPDRCYEILRDQLPHRPYPSKLILLSKNFGAFAAIRAGLKIGTGNYFAVMAADLQEPPELVLNMHQALLTGEADVVVAVRTGRKDPLLSRLPSAIFWGLYRRFVVSDVPPGGVDIFACNRAFRDQLLKLEEQHSALIAQIFWLGYRRKFIPYEREERKQGKSAWTLRKKINYLMDSIFSFTDLPIRLLIRVGGIATLFLGIFAIIITVSKLLGLINVPGYAATILTIFFFGTLNLFGLGVIGSYAWRTYENTKARPLHIVLRNHEFND